MDIYKVIKAAHITEKGSLQKELQNQIAFKVDKKANKVEIRRAVETLFKTKVVDVKTMNMKGKRRRVGRNLGKELTGKRRL